MSEKDMIPQNMTNICAKFILPLRFKDSSKSYEEIQGLFKDFSRTYEEIQGLCEPCNYNVTYKNTLTARLHHEQLIAMMSCK